MNAWLMARLSERLFRDLPLPVAWGEAVRSAAKRGQLVHVVRNESLLDLLALDHLTRKFNLPPVGFANALEAWIHPTVIALRQSPEERMAQALAKGQSIVLFMKRPPSVLAPSTTHRGRSEGDGLLRALFQLRRSSERDIVMVPQTFVWTMRPESLGFSLVDTLFGPAEFPGELRALAQYALNHKNSVLRAGQPFSVSELLAAGIDLDDAAIARRLSYALLRKVERERRAVLGPVRKPGDRVREEVLRSPKLQAVIKDLAGPGDHERRLLEARARAMLRKLEARPDPGVVRGLETVAETLVDRVYAGIDVDQEGFERVRAAAHKGTVVLLPSHKSHVDYLLMSFVMRKHGLSLPVVAAGDNLDFFPIGPIFRHAGAFFIRRQFKGDRLYTSVVDAYVRRLLRDGHTLELFLEGGRSRTGKLLSPKLGLLNMIVDAALGVEAREISFVPVSIGYERMMEEGAYARELSGGAKRKEDAAALLKVGEVLREKYGRANVQFGAVLELSELRKQVGLERTGPDDKVAPPKRRALVTRLAHRVMSEINRVTAVTPGALVALALLAHGRRGLSHMDLVKQCARLLLVAKRHGARTTPSVVDARGELREGCVREAALLYVRGGIVRQHVPGDTLTGTAKRRAKIYTGDDVIYAVPEDKRLLLDYSKNHILHLFVDRALISVALLAPPGPSMPLTTLRERVQSLSRLFKLEFAFRADATFDKNFDDTLALMIEDGELKREAHATDDMMGFGQGRLGLDGRGWITHYAATVRNFVEAYRVQARALRVLLRGSMTEKEIVERTLRIGERMFLGGEIERPEAVNGTTLENALSAFLEAGYLRRDSGKLALADSFASEEAASTIEARISAFLERRSGEV
jgi:glycerol-3-phosphate O-acyltransferase